MARRFAIAKQTYINKKISKYIAIVVGVALLAIPAVALAAASLSVSPSTNLTNGQSVTVSGSGYAANSTGSILECNDDPNQPTVEFFGNPIPVSCSSPLQALVSTNSSGNLPSTAFTVKTGVIGPPTTGTDSTGGDATTDAGSYPCPPTAAQLQAGDSCDINFGDQSNDNAIQNISFGTGGGGSGGGSSGGSGSSQSKSTGSIKSTTKATTSPTATPTATTTPAATAAPAATAKSTSTSTSGLSPATILTISVHNADYKPIAGAKVTLDNKQSLTTNKTGQATFSNVSAGAHSVLVTQNGKKTTTTKITLTSGENKLVSIKLTNKSFNFLYLALIIPTAAMLGLDLYLLFKKLKARPPKALTPLPAKPLQNPSAIPVASPLPIGPPQPAQHPHNVINYD